MTIDPNTGAVTVTPPAGLPDGYTVDIPVIVTYPDGTTDAAIVNVRITNPDVTPTAPIMANVHAPSYAVATVTPGESVALPQIGDGELPQGTTFDINPASLPQGWTATIDKTTGEVTITAPADAAEGTVGSVIVIVTYPDGSIDTVSASAVAGKNVNLPVANIDFADVVNATPGQTVTVPPVVLGNNGTIPPGTVITASGPGLPAGSRVEVDPNTGAISVTLPADAVGGPFVVTVTISVPGMPPETETIQVVLPTDTKTEVTYPDAVTVTPGAPTTVKPNINGQPGIPPAGTEIKVDTTPLPEGTKVVINPDGSVEITVPEGATPGTIPVEVTVIVPGQPPKVEIIEVTIPASAVDQNTLYEPTYDPETGTPGDSITVPIKGMADAPAGTKFEIAPEALAALEAAGWTVTVGADGTISVEIPADAEPGTEITIPVIITYPDGTIDIATATITVGEEVPAVPADNAVNEPNYEPVKVNPGESVTVGQTGDTTLPAGTKVTIDTSTLPEGWTATVDPVTGEVTVTVPADAKPGTEGHALVDFIYPDGTVDHAVVTVTVGKPETPTPTPTPTPGGSSDNGSSSTDGSSEAGIISLIIGGVVVGGAIIGAGAAAGELSSTAVIGGLPGFPGLPGVQGSSTEPGAQLPGSSNGDIFVPSSTFAPAPSSQPAQPGQSQPAQPSQAAPAKPAAPAAQPGQAKPGAPAAQPAQPASEVQPAPANPHQVVPAPGKGALANTGVKLVQWAFGLGVMLLALGMALMALVRRKRG